MSSSGASPPPDPWAAPSGGGWSSPGLSAPAASDTTPAPPPSSDHRYERRGLLGQGGMGRVWAVYDHLLGREVALKEVAPALNGPALQARLEREARITAAVEHPGVVPVYDAGRGPDGALYYTMRLVRGRTLSEVVGERPTLEGRLRLVRVVLGACQAVAAAHARGVVHRDLKPGNIMVGAHGEVQVVDWGLARGVDAPELGLLPSSPDGPGTQVGDVIGTPAWMSPEQARGEPATARSDVYSLGAVVFMVVTGRAPGAAPLPPDVPRDLAALIARAMSDAPLDRYADAGALAHDLAAWLDGRRVAAHDYTLDEVVRRWVARRRAPLAVAGVAAFLLVALGAATWWRTDAERRRAVQAEADARTALKTADAWLASALTEQAVAAHLADNRRRAEVLAAYVNEVADRPEARGVLAATDPQARPKRRSHRPLPCPVAIAVSPDGGWVACHHDGATSIVDTRAGEEVWRGPPSEHVALGADVALVTSANHHLHLRLPEGEVQGEIAVPFAALPVRLSADGQRVAWGAGDQVYTYALADPRPRQVAACAAATQRVRLGVPLADGRVVVLCSDATLSISAPDGTRLDLAGAKDGSAHMANTLTITDDERTALVGDVRGNVASIDLRTGAIGPVLHAVQGSVPLIAARGRVAAVLDSLGNVGVWDLDAQRVTARLRADEGALVAMDAAGLVHLLGPHATAWYVPDGPVAHLLLNDDGISAIATAADHEVTSIDGAGSLVRFSASGAVVARTRWQQDVGKSLWRDPDGVLFAGTMGPPYLARVAPDGALLPGAPPVPMAARRVVRGPDGRIATLAYDPLVRLWPPEGGEPAKVTLTEIVMDLAVGDDLWALSKDGLLHHIDEDAATVRAEIPGGVAIAASGPLAAVASPGGVTLVSPGTPPRRVDVPGLARPTEIALSRDGRTAAAGAIDGLVYVLDVPEGRLLAVLPGHRERVAALEFAPGDEVLVSGSWDSTLRRWWMAPLREDPSRLRRQIEDAWGVGVEELLSP